MKIGIDARLTYYRTGGISTYVRQLVRALEALDHEHEYTVFHSRKARERISSRFGSATLWTPAHHRYERMALSVELARHQLDVLHSPDFISPHHGARAHVITVHDITFLHYPQFLTADSRRYYNDQIVGAVRDADHILVDSHATLRDLIEMLHVPREKMTTHKLGVDAAFRPMSAAEIAPYRAEYGLPNTYLLFVGTFEPRKNIMGLLNAYELVLKDVPNAPPIVLAGTRGWLFDETMAHIEQIGLKERILWREGVKQSAMPALYAGARALAMPSFYEGFGLPALEAMACGTLPIVSNRSSLPEVVGDVGIQVNPDDPQSIADGLKRAIGNDAWVTAQKPMLLAQAARFTWEETARIAKAVYEKAGAR
jgi:glycosyltransferase involved in cell wall biosynthesis